MQFTFETQTLQFPQSSAETRGNEDAILEEEDPTLDALKDKLGQDIMDIVDIIHNKLHSHF